MTTSLETTLAGTRYQSYLYAYPHKTAYRPIEPALPLGPLWANERRDALFLYVHVPFCEQRCGFCNLFTRPVPPTELVDAYLATLACQVRVVRAALDEGGPFTFSRAAIGGGTPTLLDARQLELVMAAFRTMGAHGDIPMSVETSPETALPDRLRVVVGGGADRISMGVQSFVESECKAVNRPQQVADVHAAIRAIRDTGVATLNLDLMYGLPAQTETTWRYSLDAALAYRPEEVYLYPLYVRPLTTLGKKETNGTSMHRAMARPVIVNPIDRHRVALYEQGRALLLESGYRQISMRMFRKETASANDGPVYCCQDDGMVGIGCGARSYTRTVHYSSEWAVGARGVRDIIDRWVAQDDAAFGVADYGFVLDSHEQRRRWLILSLLADDGLDVATYRARFGRDPADDFPELGELAPHGLVEQSAATIRLTPDGLARADAIGPWLASDSVRQKMADYTLT
ncbi:MAG: STM4012 family radical SAM protein [Deltaproteobacteria bacterium]|nr:STM4012 family radical SAM protein [Deltaproteobacteria bacterium]